MSHKIIKKLEFNFPISTEYEIIQVDNNDYKVYVPSIGIEIKVRNPTESSLESTAYQIVTSYINGCLKNSPFTRK